MSENENSNSADSSVMYLTLEMGELADSVLLQWNMFYKGK